MERKAEREEEALDVQAKVPQCRDVCACVSDCDFVATQNTRKTLCCVRRCARHWRELTRRHRPPTMRRGVSSTSTLASQESDVWNNLVK